MDPLLDGLDARQRDAVTTDARPLAVLAPAGSGKTRVLTRRIAYRAREGTAEPRHMLAVTFTRHAAGQLVDRLSALDVDALTAGTFHALALAQLRRRALEQGREPPTVLASKQRVLAAALDRAMPGRSRRRGPSVSELAAEIEWAKARMIRPDAYAAAVERAGRRMSAATAGVAEVYAAYEAEKRRRRCCDFEDLLWLCADAIETDPAFAAAQRWRFRHFFVDEFQDATPLQVRLLRAWLGDRSDLCVVGDVAQAIYGFAGADAAPLATFAAHFPGGTVIDLTQNYRSTPQVVAVAEAVLGRTSGVERPPMRAMRPDGDAPGCHAYADEHAEAAAVAQRCRDAFVSGVPWHDMAVLFRTNAQSAVFEAAFDRRGIPFRAADRADATARPALREPLERLRRIERESRHRPFAEHLADLVHEPSEPRFDAELADGERSGRAPEPDARAGELLRLGREYLASEDGPGSVAAFTTWLELSARDEHRGPHGVDLTTFHRAKGLEWRVVCVTGLEEGLVPVGWATSPAEIAEERRLLHVALGRAVDVLHLSWCRTRTVAGRRVRREPSPWLSLLEHRARRAALPPVDGRVALAAVRETLLDVGPPRSVRRNRRAR
jgi:DNA helicase-2/ATP-dependent DNA helicase PcrA